MHTQVVCDYCCESRLCGGAIRTALTPSPPPLHAHLNRRRRAVEAIAGPWMRCCKYWLPFRLTPTDTDLLPLPGLPRAGHCPESLDLCSPCLNAIHHDPSHVFVRLKRKVDLPLFRQMYELDPVRIRLGAGAR